MPGPMCPYGGVHKNEYNEYNPVPAYKKKSQPNLKADYFSEIQEVIILSTNLWLTGCYRTVGKKPLAQCWIEKKTKVGKDILSSRNNTRKEQKIHKYTAWAYTII